MMKKLLILGAILTLSACANTWQGAKKDGRYTLNRTSETVERGWDKTKSAVKKGGQAVGEGFERTGEYLQDKFD